MRVIFDKYEFFDSANEDNNTYTSRERNDKAFDKSYYNQLVTDRRYVDAADYLELFRFKDPKVQLAHENDIETLRTKGEAISAIYSRISNKDDKAKLELYNKVFTGNQLETINTTNKTKDDYNSYAADLIKAKDNLGKHGNYDYSNEIGIIFKPKKRSRLGIDFLAEDNPYDINYFYDTTGFTKQQLINAGIQVIEEDGTTELKFDKSHPLANKILDSTPTESDIAANHLTSGILSGLSSVLESATVGLISLGMTGRENPADTSSFNTARAYAPLVVGYTKNGEKVFNYRGGIGNHFAFQDLERFKSIIRNARNTTEAAFQKLNLDKKAYSSIAMPWISDELYQLRNSGLSETEYNRQAKLIAPNIFNALNSLGSANYEMYSNYYNAKAGDETLEELDNVGRNKIINIISGAKPSELQVDAYTANGKIGALVTVAAKYKQSNTDEGAMIHPRYQVFIPGLLVEEAQARLNRDTKAKAVQKLNNMVDWQYDYKTSDGDTISPTTNGVFLKNKKPISKDEAIQDINRDIAMKSMIKNLRYIHTGRNGNLVKADEYETEARFGSLAIAAELYSGQIGQSGNNISINGNIHTIDQIFDKEIDMDDVNYDSYHILTDIYNMYNKIMGDLIYYKK